MPAKLHGRSHTKEWYSHRDMHRRCNDPKSRWFEKGITVCKRWSHDANGFQNFLSDMGECPPDKRSVDRIDNGGNYEPGNCRWATCAEQAKNQDKRRPYTRRVNQYPKFCRICGVDFIAGQPTGQYCSAACRQRAFRGRAL